MRIPPPARARQPRRRHPARVAHHRGARRHRRAAHRRRRRVHRRLGAGPDLLPDGLRRRLVADGQPRRLAGTVRHRPRGAQGPRLPARRKASRCCRRSTGRPRACRTSGRPDGFHERQVDRWTAFLERIKGRELPGFDEASAWLRAHRPLDFVPGLMHGDYQFANVMFRHGAPARLAAIVDWEMGTVGDPKLDLAWVLQSWPEDTSAPDVSGSGYVDIYGMPSRDELLAHYCRGVRPAGRRHRLLRRPRQVEARRRARAGLPARRRRHRSSRRSARSCSTSWRAPPSSPRRRTTSHDAPPPSVVLRAGRRDPGRPPQPPRGQERPDTGMLNGVGSAIIAGGVRPGDPGCWSSPAPATAPSAPAWTCGLRRAARTSTSGDDEEPRRLSSG